MRCSTTARSAAGEVEQATSCNREPNPRVELAEDCAAVEGGAAVWGDLSIYQADAMLISQVGWWPDSKSAVAYVQNRTQTTVARC